MASVLKKKEAIILAIDIGKNSSLRDLDGKTHFEKSIFCASMILKRKILTESEDHLALILFGSSHTINHLSSEGHCYGNIEIVAGLGVPTWDLLNRVNSSSPTNVTPSDWISTFVLSADLLRTNIDNKLFSGFQIVMFSNLSTDIPFHNIDIIASCLKLENVKLSIIGNDCEVLSLHSGFDVFLKTTEATAVTFDLILPKISYYKQKEVIEKSWNAPLSFGETFYIKVYGHQKIDITTKSSDWLFSKDYDRQDIAAAIRNPIEENDLNTEEYTYKITGTKCLQVLGFVKTTNTQASFLIGGGSYIFRPHKTDIIAFNAIFDYMVEREEVILVRKVDLYINLLNIGALFPQKEGNEKFFVYASLPNYVEDDDTYKLPPLESIKPLIIKNLTIEPTDAMDVDIDGNTFVMPEMKYDFKLQSLYDCMVQQILTKIIPEKIQCPVYPIKSIIKNAESPFNEFKNAFSIKEEVSENYPAEDIDTYQFGYDEELDVSNDLINSPKSIMENGEPPFNELNNTVSIKQEVSENCPDEDINTYEFGYDEELDVSNDLINSPNSIMENGEPPFNELNNTVSIKQEVSENCPDEDINTYEFGYDEELDVSNDLINSPNSIMENGEPPSNELNNTVSIKQEVSENCPDEDINTYEFGYDEELDVSNDLINSPNSIMENGEPPSNELNNTVSIKQEVSENCPDEDINTYEFGYDEELDVSNDLINSPNSIMENGEPPSNELNNTVSIKQEVSENCPDEDINTYEFGCDEELDVSNDLINSPNSIMENGEPPSNELNNTVSIKQEVSENCPDEDINTYEFGYDEELDVSNDLINSPNSIMENGEPPSNELNNTVSIKQEVSENCPDEDINTYEFGYDEELDVSNDLINSPNSIMENGEPPSNELNNTVSIKQEVSENGPAEDNDTTQFGYDDELDVSNDLINNPKSIRENAEPPFNEFKNTISIKQEVSLNSSIEDNGITKVGCDEELDVSKQCLITPLNPIEDFNKLLKNGFDSAIGGIGPITNEEIKESDISQESSEEFMKLSGDFDKDY